MSAPDPRETTLSVVLADAVLDEIVDRVSERVLAAGSRGVEPWVGVADVAAHLACRRQRIYDLVGRGGPHRIPHRRDGTRLLFLLSEVDAWLADGK